MSPVSPPSPWIVPEGVDQRLDVFLAEALDLPRNQIGRLISEERFRISGKPVKASLRLKGGELISFDPPPPRTTFLLPEEGPLDYIVQEPDFVVLNKPAGLAMHPGAGRPTKTLVHRILHHHPEVEGVGGEGRPGVVHRLDIDTTGLVLVALTQEAYLYFSKDFADRKVKKTYLAVTHGRIQDQTGTLEAPIGRHPNRRKEMTVLFRGGRRAVTHYKVLESSGSTSLVEIELETGRTHQIRVHFKHRGYPLVGDPTYGEARWKNAEPRQRKALKAFPRPALHAWKLAFTDPRGVQWNLEAPLPSDVVQLWSALGGQALAQRSVETADASGLISPDFP